jgi:hypothetical protein
VLVVLVVLNPGGLVPPPAIASVVSVPVPNPVAAAEVEIRLEPEELTLLVPVVLLLLFLTVPPTAPPTTAPMTMRAMRTTVITPLRLRQKDVRGSGAGRVCAGEVNFSPEPVPAMPGVKGTVGWAIWGAVWGGGLRTEGVRRGGCSRRSTL